MQNSTTSWRYSRDDEHKKLNPTVKPTNKSNGCSKLAQEESDAKWTEQVVTVKLIGIFQVYSGSKYGGSEEMSKKKIEPLKSKPIESD